jgi:hypothetical protein
MNAGRMFQQGFEMLFRHQGGPVTIYRGYGTPEQTEREILAMKNCEKGRPNEGMFQFREQLDVVAGDVIQQQGSRDIWIVSDTEDSIVAGNFICFEAKVRKLSQRSQEIVKHSDHTTITVQGGVTGGLVVNSPNTIQNVAIHLPPEVANACKQLRELLSNEGLNDLDREDGRAELSRLEHLATRERSPDVLERAKNRIEALRTILSSVQEMAATAGPWLVILWQYFNK